MMRVRPTDPTEETALEYFPQPMDTSHVVLSDDLSDLTEMLARNTHEVWSSQRLAEGWRYGPERDDQKKEHPGLVPYEQLSESEREYDRNTALETLKVILALGYRIDKKIPGTQAGSRSTRQEQDRRKTK